MRDSDPRPQALIGLGLAAGRILGAVVDVARIATTTVCTGLLLAIVAIVLIGVIARYVFNDAFSWTEELATWAFGWLIFCGAALGNLSRKHVCLDFLERRLTRPWRLLQEFVIDLIIAYATIKLIDGGELLIRLIGGSSPALHWPNNLPYAMVPAAGYLGLFFLVASRRGDGVALGLSAAAVIAAFGLHGLLSMMGGQILLGTSPSLIMLVTFVAAITLGVPIAYSIIFAVVVANWGADLLPIPAAVQNMVVGSSRFVLLAIPFFLTAGYLMNFGGITARIINLADALVGHLRGGLAQVNVVNSALMGGISGSSSADAASDTKMIVPEMVKRGYSAPFACAVTAASSILPNIIPPSIAMLVYASIAEASIARLFVGGIVPGILLAFLMMGTVYCIARVRNYEAARTRAPLRRVLLALLSALPALGTVAIILFVLRFGIATVTESAVMAVLWAFVLGKFIYRAYGWGGLTHMLADSALDTALVGFLIAVSVPFGWILIAEQMPQAFVAWAVQLIQDPFGLMLLTVLVLVLAGALLDGTACMLITVPMLLPLSQSLGVDPVQFGIVVVVTVMLGGITPPYGVLVFVSASIARLPPNAIFRECLPFIGACLAAILLLILFPELSLGLWRLIGD